VLLVIGLGGFFIFAKNSSINPFHSRKTETSKEEIKEKYLLLEDFHSFNHKLDNSVLLGGGNQIISFDTLHGKILALDHFVDEKIQFSNIYLNLEKVKKTQNSPLVSVRLFDFIQDQVYGKLMQEKVERGFYFGIYRELIENIENWQNQYKSLIVTNKIISDSGTGKQVLVILKTYKNLELSDIAFLLPLNSTNHHLYDFLVTKKSLISTEIKGYLEKYKYSFPNYTKIKSDWKVNPKKFELRNLKWNFD
jgi:hypothetical protein